MEDLVRREAVAGLPPSELAGRLLDSRLYFERPDRPGFLVVETGAGLVVPVFTSWEGLALFAGVCDWASTTTRDLLELLPEDVRALVDPLDGGGFLLDSAAVAELVETGER